MPFFACFQNLKKKSYNNPSEYYDRSFTFNITEQNSYQSFEENLEYPSDAINFKFNFNPNEDKVDAFIAKILRTALDETKLNEFKAKQSKLDCLLANYRKEFNKEKKDDFQKEINNLSWALKLESKQVIEKIKLTFRGFDICKQAMPLELLHPLKGILDNTILFLILLGYVNTQIISLFEMSIEQYEELRRKGRQRNKCENIKFETILTFVDKIKSFISLTRSKCNAENKEKINKEKIAILDELKVISKEGKTACYLLQPLLNYNSEASEFMLP